ncbi:aldose 1-epimerase family protein [Chakrabartyella piscis]|uniref:aldose 1-epimerase family protein n=1 Tax=Chakrabartyella piscis TaxID=2918914 RepID=UPI0029588B5A|nr:aldose 1-epimerase family protein [Chakrabartyella piscis]
MYTIKNEVLTIQISDKGAELRSILDKNGREWLWQGNPQIWAGQAPLLFPFIGRLQNNSYTYKGVTYDMPKHGFARDANFSITHHTENSITFTLTHDEHTLKIYPFSFCLEVTYTLDGTKLCKTHCITNHTDGDMYYELGGHDAYNLCFSYDETMDDCHFYFNDLDDVYPYEMNEDLLLLPSKKQLPLKNHALSVKPNTFDLDCIILDHLDSKYVALKDGKGKIRISMEFSDFPIVTLWTADKPQDTNYVCIEPWSSLPDCTFVGRSIADKKNIRHLKTNASETLSFQTQFHVDKW